MAKGIDHIFVSKDITHNIINLTISDDIFAQSRHKTVTLEIANLFENPLGVRINHRIPEFLITYGVSNGSSLKLKAKYPLC